MKRTVTIAGALVMTMLAVGPAGVSAHTDSDLVGVPAGTASTVTLKPTHGCGESPTVAVRIRAPFPDARADEVEGWTAASTPDGAGNTVLEWTGGLLPADQDGAFPVTFTVSDTPGVLLTFPAIQVCENGEELAWISGDPEDEFPAPRVLVLPADAEPAETIDDVPLDAPGREQLAAIVDVDNPNVVPTTLPPATAAPATIAPTGAPTTVAAVPPATLGVTPAQSAPAATAASATPSTAAATSAPIAEDSEDSGGSAGPIVVIAVLVAAAAIGGVVAVRRHRAVDGASAGVGAGDDLEEVGSRPGDP